MCQIHNVDLSTYGVSPGMLLSMWANPPEHMPVKAVRPFPISENNRNYPKIRKAKVAKPKTDRVMTPARAAALAIISEKYTKARIQKYSCMRDKGLMYSKEIAELVFIDPDSIRPILMDLVDRGVLERVVHNRSDIQYRWAAE